VRVAPLDDDGAPTGDLTEQAGVTGEVVVAASHVRDHYDRLWRTDRVARAGVDDPRGHRTGDVGHLDAAGRLWVEGRLGHVITTADGPVTPVGLEQRVQEVDGVAAAAVVGVGPVGTQQVVVVVVPDPGRAARRPGAPLLATAALTAAVRAAARGLVAAPVAAVLVAGALPVDIRHAAKVDRARVAAWAERVLAGERAGRRP
jgi:acyl-coenzyme A synthetase/AMP-(fatty) acid ligase